MADDEEDLNQDDIDALIGGAMDAAADPAPPPPPEPQKPPELEDDVEFNQDAIDSLIDKELGGALVNQDDADATDLPGAEDDDVGQDDIDAIMASLEEDASTQPDEETEPAATQEPESDDTAAEESGEISQDDIEALMADMDAVKEEPEAAPDPPEDETSDAMDQSAIDALLGDEPTAEPTPAKSEDEPGIEIDQDEIDDAVETDDQADAIVREAAETRSTSDDGIELSQDDIDQAVERGPAEKPEPVEPDTTLSGDTIDQAAIDALISGSDDAVDAVALADDAPIGDQDLDEVLGDVGAIDQADIDALIDGTSPSAEPKRKTVADGIELDQNELDEIVAEDDKRRAEEATSDLGAVSQADIDALISGEEPAPQTKPVDSSNIDILQENLDELDQAALLAQREVNIEPLVSGGDDILSQDIIDALVDEASVAEEVGSENVAAGAEDQEPLPQEVIDDLVGTALADESAIIAVDHSDTPQPGPATVTEPEPEAVADPEPSAKRPPITIDFNAFLARHGFKLGTSIAAGLTIALATYGALTLNPTQHVPALQVQRIAKVPIDSIVGRARELNAAGKYSETIKLLDPAIAGLPADEYNAEAEYLRIEAYYKGLSEFASAEELAALIGTIDTFLVTATEDPRAGQLLYWQSRLFEQQGFPYIARQTLERLLRTYANAPNRDQIMIEIARLSLEIGQNEVAAGYLDSVLTEFPSSPAAGRARLLSGDVQRALGNRENARQTYEQLAATHPDSALAAEAYGRLGSLSFDEGNYGEAIDLLEKRRQLATSIDGNDEVFLLLAKSYRAEGQYEKAEEVLRELIDFFPESSVQPQAYVELSQVLDARGERAQAVNLARQAAERFSETPDVAENAGDLAARAGDTRGAARYYETADAMGAGQADVLLKAGKQHMRAGKDLQAAEAFERLLELYPASPEAAEAGIALAETHYARGRTAEAVDQLNALMGLTEGQPQRLPVLRAIGAIYTDLGLDDKAGEVYAELAQLSSEPQVMADSAHALFNAGRIEQAYDLMEEIPMDRLTPETAYGLLYAEADTRLRANADAAIAVMERARETYPSARTVEGDDQLFNAYLTTGNVPKARGMLSDLERAVEADAAQGHVLRRRALQWADYHFDRGDYKTAADGYDLVLNTQGPINEQDLHWARFQRANALLERNDTTGALIVLDEIAGAASPWSDVARTKAERIRLDARLRGTRVSSSS